MKNNKGFTLVELLVSIGIMSIIMTLVTTMMINASRFFEKQSVFIELNNEIQVINNYLSESFMEATAMNFTITDDTTNAGRYELYKTDDTGAVPATAKGVQRYLYYYNDPANADPEKRHVLYVVAFKETDTIPADPSGTEADDIYLLSKNVSEFAVEIPTRTVIDPDAPELAPGDPAPASEEVVKNPVVANITYKVTKNNISLDCELTVDCRNKISKVKITKADGSVYEYKATDR